MLDTIKFSFIKIFQSFEGASVLATAALLLKPLKDMVYNELSFFSILTMAIIIDLIIGGLKYWKINMFSFSQLVVGLIIKVTVAFGGITLFLAFKSLDPGIAAEWFALVAKFTVLLYPAGSAFTNMYILTNGRFPPIGLMKRLDSFDKMAEYVSDGSKKHKQDDAN